MDRVEAGGDAEADEPTPSLAEDLEGTPYRPIGAIGQGGMGAVYEIVHKTLGRRLVLKVLRASRRPDLEDRLRFEAQTLAQLSHPNLLAVVDFGRTRSNRPYLVTELLRGRTLKELLGAKGFLSVREAAQYIVQALEGLSSAHRAGVIHRDIKTDNIFVCDATGGNAPVIKLIDFGIAKIAESHEEGRVNVEPLHVPTADGMMVGTPSYVSPEQIFAEKVDQRTDVFGMGMVLYRLIAGRGPFQYRDVLQIVEANAREPAQPPSKFASQSIPPQLDAIVLKAIEKRREDRFQTAKEMAEALLPFTMELQKVEPSPRVSNHPVHTVLLAPVTPPTGMHPAASPLLGGPSVTPRGTQMLISDAQDPRHAHAPLNAPTMVLPEASHDPRAKPPAGSAPMVSKPMPFENPQPRDRVSRPGPLAMMPATPPRQAAKAGQTNLYRWIGLVVAVCVAGGLTFLLFKLLGWT